LLIIVAGIVVCAASIAIGAFWKKPRNDIQIASVAILDRDQKVREMTANTQYHEWKPAQGGRLVVICFEHEAIAPKIGESIVLLWSDGTSTSPTLDMQRPVYREDRHGRMIRHTEMLAIGTLPHDSTASAVAALAFGYRFECRVIPLGELNWNLSAAK